VADDKGRVKLEDWTEAMNSTLKLDIKWELITPYVAKVKNNLINYTEFLDRFIVPVNKNIVDGIVSLVCAHIIEHKQKLKEFFEEVDVNKEGNINYEEMMDSLKKFDLGLSEDQLYDFMESFDSDKDGKISFKEFETRFGSTFKSVDNRESWLSEAINQMSLHFHKENKPIKHYFEKYDSNKSSKINYTEFSHLIKRHFKKLNLSKEQRHAFFVYLDKNESGNVTIEEFANVFEMGDIKASTWQYTVLQQLYDTIRLNKEELLSLFRHYDVSKDGKLDMNEFKAAMRTINSVNGKPLTNDQIKIMFRTFDKDNNGVIDYKEFLTSFKVVLKNE